MCKNAHFYRTSCTFSEKPLASDPQLELGRYFMMLANSLTPNSHYIEQAHKVAEEIFDALSNFGLHSPSSYGFQLHRFKVAGSIGKGTAITYVNPVDMQKNNPDLDLVLFVNNAGPPFERQYSTFAKLLKRHNDISGVIKRKYSIEFKVWIESIGNIKVDLLCAENLVKYQYPWRDPGTVEAIVAKKALNKKQKKCLNETGHITQLENKLSSTAFAEKTVDVIRKYVEEDDDVLDVVRLAKYWNNRIDFSEFGYIPAKSCIIELIAIYSSQSSDTNLAMVNTSWQSVLQKFTQFLEYVSEFRTLDISLKKETDKRKKLKYYNLPMIMDPVNDWNNLAEGIPPKVFLIWENQARITWRYITNFRKFNPNESTDMIFSHKNEVCISISEDEDDFV